MEGYVVKMFVLMAERKKNEKSEYFVMHITDDRKKAEKLKMEEELLWKKETSDDKPILSIIEQDAEISDMTKHQISRVVDRECKMQDIISFLDNLYKSGNVEKWKYEFALKNQNVLLNMLYRFEKCESCEVPENSSMEYAVNEALDNIQLNNGKAEYIK